MRKRNKYTEDYKRDAVALVTEQGYKPVQAANSLGINENNLRHWIKGFIRLNYIMKRKLQQQS
jgi:transposase